MSSPFSLGFIHLDGLVDRFVAVQRPDRCWPADVQPPFADQVHYSGLTSICTSM